MSTLRVTIGGQEVALTPGGWVHQQTSAAAPVASQTERQDAGRSGQTAAIVGLLAILGLLIFLIIWLSQRRHQG